VRLVPLADHADDLGGEVHLVPRQASHLAAAEAQITGLRRREVAGLTWYQVDFAAEVIRVVGKGDKPLLQSRVLLARYVKTASGWCP
jgi:integrase